MIDRTCAECFWYNKYKHACEHPDLHHQMYEERDTFQARYCIGFTVIPEFDEDFAFSEQEPKTEDAYACCEF